MSKKEIVRRYMVFSLGLILTAFGVAFITKAALGSSPVAAIPYSLSLVFPKLTIGNWTIIFSLLLILLQLVLLRKDAKKIELVLQIGISIALGYLIDGSMWILQAFDPQAYVMKLISLFIGCVIIAFGAYFQVIGDVAMLPGDATARALAKVTGKEFGTMRMVSDVTMTVVAGAICLVFLHKLNGVREGTLIASLLIGNIVKLLSRWLKPLEMKLVPYNK